MNTSLMFLAVQFAPLAQIDSMPSFNVWLMMSLWFWVN